MKVKQKQRFLCKVFMGLVLTSSVFHDVRAAGAEFENNQADNDYYRQQVESLNTESVKKIGAKIREYHGILAQAKKKDLTVFIGNKGSGKSTSVNTLGSKRFDIDPKTAALTLARGEDGFLVGAGSGSVTEYPQHIWSDTLGMVFDLPGFKDTEGAIKDIVNAALIKHLLENAKSVRVVLTLSQAEFDGVRSEEVLNVLKYIRMLSSEFLDQSVTCLVNRVDRDTMDIFSSWIEDKVTKDMRNLQLKTWIDNKKVFALPKARIGSDAEKYIQDNKKTLENHIGKLPKMPTGSLDVAMTLGDKSSEELKEFFIAKIAEQLKESVENDWPNMVREFCAGQFKESKKTVLDRFIQKLEASEEIHLLKPLGTPQYNKTLSSFTYEQGAFSSELRLFLAQLEVKECDRIIKEANARAEKAEAEAAIAKAKAADEKENQAGATTEADKKIAAAKVRKAEADAEKAEAEAATAKAEAAKEKEKGKKEKEKEAEAEENRNSSWGALTNLRSAAYNALSVLYNSAAGYFGGV